MTGLRDALPATIRTERLRLAAPRLEDLTELVPLADNENVTRWTARMPYPYGHADGADFIENIANGTGERPYAVRNETGAFIGIVSLMFPGARPELGYWLGEQFWGRGYGSEAVAALLGAARATGLAPVIEARALADNRASLRILEKQGFARIGEFVGDCGRNKDRLIVHLELDFER